MTNYKRFTVGTLLGAAILGCCSSTVAADAMRNRWASVLGTTDNFADASALLRVTDQIGMRTYDKRSCDHSENAQPIVATLAKAHFVRDTNPVFLAKRDFTECASYRRELSCDAVPSEAAQYISASKRSTHPCRITDGVRFCIGLPPDHDRCKEVLEAWAGRWVGPDVSSASVLNDSSYRSDIATLLFPSGI